MTGIERIAKERQRQINEEGWDAEHDDDHDDGELALVGALYATPILLYRERKWEHSGPEFTDPWPASWDCEWDKRDLDDREEDFIPNDKLSLPKRIRNLEKAGALIAAEIDRLLRVAAAGEVGR